MIEVINDVDWYELFKFGVSLCQFVIWFMVLRWLRSMSDDIKILVARLREAEVNVEVLQWQVKADKTRAYPIVQQEEERVVAKEKDEKRKYKKHIWLTNDEAAQLLKMPKSTFSQWTSSGRIPSRLRRGKMLYDKEVLEKFSVADIRQRMYEKRPSSRGNTDNKK